MTPEAFRELYREGTALALSPLLTLTVGVVLLLIVEMLRDPGKLRAIVFAGTLVAAVWCETLILAAPPGTVLDGTYSADTTSAAWGLVFLAATALAWAFGRRYYRAARHLLGEHDVLLLTTPIGMMLMAGAQDLLVFFIGLELLSVPLYCLAGFRRSRNDSVEAGLKYFVLGAFGVAIFLFGAALVYVDTGTLSLVTLRGEGLGSSLGSAGVGLIVASLFFKISIVPFHLWVPDVYQGSPTPVTVLMSTGTKAAGFAFLLNVAFLLPAAAVPILSALAVLTMAIGNLGALVQEDLKRMLAYSSVAHAGTLLIVVAGALAGDTEPSGPVQAALYYMAAYTFTAGGAFGLISWLEADGERFTRLESLRGLAMRRPAVAAALALFMLSLGGIPATGGFLGKWLVFSVAVRAELVPLAVIGVLLSVIALGYYLRVVVAMYMQPELEGVAPSTAVRPAASIATAACVAMVVVLGVLPGIFLR